MLSTTNFYHFHQTIDFVLFFLPCVFSGDGGITHSLSWHRKGERVTGCKLYARVWTPEDPRATQKNHTTKYPHATEQTRI